MYREIVGWNWNLSPSGARALDFKSDCSSLKPGLTAVIRARNEALTIRRCLEDIGAIFDEIIVIDNGSEDDTHAIATRTAELNTNIRVYKYDEIIPAVGVAHAKNVLSGMEPTLASYYNFCLSKVRTFNFIKWDADFIPIIENLSSMRETLQLSTRGDRVAVWCSGTCIWTDGEMNWLDRQPGYNEFRVLSHKHGARYVNLPEWEEIDQSYLFSASLLCWEKPIFAEIKDIRTMNFEDRGFNPQDTRDKMNRKALNEYRASGELPSDRFVSITDFSQDQLTNESLSKRETEMAQNALLEYRFLPTIYQKKRQLASRTERREFWPLLLFCPEGGQAMKDLDLSEQLNNYLIKAGLHYFLLQWSSSDDVTISDNRLQVSSSFKHKVSDLAALLDENGFAYSHIVLIPLNAAIAPKALLLHLANQELPTRLIDMRDPSLFSSVGNNPAASSIKIFEDHQNLPTSQSRMLDMDQKIASSRTFTVVTDWYDWGKKRNTHQ
jgi:hypothetical protein